MTEVQNEREGDRGDDVQHEEGLQVIFGDFASRRDEPVAAANHDVEIDEEVQNEKGVHDLLQDQDRVEGQVEGDEEGHQRDVVQEKQHRNDVPDEHEARVGPKQRQTAPPFLARTRRLLELDCGLFLNSHFLGLGFETHQLDFSLKHLCGC